MGKELLLVAEVVKNEKGVDQEIIFDAIKSALEAATRKAYGTEIGVRVDLDTKTGDYETFRFWEVMEDPEEGEFEFPDRELTLAQARERDENLNVGDVIEELIESVEFGRITAQVAKQEIIRRLREAKRVQEVEAYQDRVGELLTGVVTRTTREFIFVDLGGSTEAALPRDQLISSEAYRPNDRIRALLYEVTSQPKGPQLYLSRTKPEMLMELFRIEVPEIAEDVIQIKGAARDPGVRSKIAVKTNDGRIDPIGACVGMRGSRVQAVSGELGGERIDIILWDGDPAQLVLNALQPAEVVSIVMDEDKHAMDIAVEEAQLSMAIGRGGQNIRLASQLSGWVLNVMSKDDLAEKTKAASVDVLSLFTEKLEVEEDLANLLIAANFKSIEEIAYAPEQELLVIEGFDDELVAALRARASDVLLDQALDMGASLGKAEPADDLLEMEGMTRHLAYIFAGHGIITREDLAEKAVDELSDIEELTEEDAAKLIMIARAPWFAESE